jgi:hypothetical protein
MRLSGDHEHGLTDVARHGPGDPMSARTGTDRCRQVGLMCWASLTGMRRPLCPTSSFAFSPTPTSSASRLFRSRGQRAGMPADRVDREDGRPRQTRWQQARADAVRACPRFHQPDPRAHGHMTDRQDHEAGSRPNNRRSGGIVASQGKRSVKPSAQPTLVRTQHLPPHKSPGHIRCKVIWASQLPRGWLPDCSLASDRSSCGVWPGQGRYRCSCHLSCAKFSVEQWLRRACPGELFPASRRPSWPDASVMLAVGAKFKTVGCRHMGGVHPPGIF